MYSFLDGDGFKLAIPITITNNPKIKEKMAPKWCILSVFWSASALELPLSRPKNCLATLSKAAARRLAPRRAARRMSIAKRRQVPWVPLQ